MRGKQVTAALAVARPGGRERLELARSVKACSGRFLHIPKGSTHAWTNVGTEPAKLLTLYTPAGFEKLFETLGEPITDPQTAPPKSLDFARLREAGYAYGLEIADRP